MPEIKDYASLLPTEPPQAVMDMAEKYFADSNALIYRVEYYPDPLTQIKEKRVRCTCTACGDSFLAQWVSGCSCHGYGSEYGFFNPRTGEAVDSYTNTLCPTCGAPVKARSISSFSDDLWIDHDDFVNVDTVEGKLCIFAWRISKYANKDGRIHYQARPFEAYIADGRKMYRCVGDQRYFYSYRYFSSWEQRKRCDDTLCRVNKERILPFNADILVGTDCENSKLDIFCKSDDVMLVSYLRLWQKYHNVENLVVQGMGEVVNQALISAAKQSYGNPCCRGTTVVDGMFFKEAKPHKILGLSKEDYLQVKKAKWEYKAVIAFREYRDYDKSVNTENFKNAWNLIGTGASFDVLKKSGESLVKAANYLVKQRVKYPQNKDRITAKEMLDYWNMAQIRSEKTGEPIERYPQNLIAKHDQLVELAEFERQKELLEAFAKRVEKLAPFAFTDEETGLMIFACPDEAQLIKEGKTLHHCVATYAKPHAQGNTAIFFIRHTDKPDEPFFTLELDEKTYRVRQNRGLRNCARTSEVTAFEKKWLEYLKSNNIGKDVKKNGKRNRKSNDAAAVA